MLVARKTNTFGLQYLKPFLTNKGCNFDTDIILNEDEKLLSDQSEISNVFNNFFVNVAKDIGKDSTPMNDCHPSICKIKDRCRRVAPYTPTRSCVHIGVLKKKKIKSKTNKINKE